MFQLDMFGENPKPTTSFSELLAEMKAMTDDILHPAGTNMVIYRGNPGAKLMIVGEAPGPQENIQLKPFVGRSGKLLDQILHAAGFDPDTDVFITNAVFRMPPGDDGSAFRKPTTEEIEFYKPYLLKIIHLIDPVIILVTGNVSTQALIGKTGITKLRGKWDMWQGRYVMPVFHPSYLLRNPSREPGGPKALTWGDFKEIKRKYDELIGDGA